MPDYAKMYKKLFNAQTDAIGILQKAQQRAEEIYVSYFASCSARSNAFM